MSVGVTVTTTTGVRADISAKVQASIGVKAQVSIDVKVQAQAAALASVECLAEMRAQMLAAGEIRIEDEPELEDVEEIDEESAELDMADEDEDREDEESSEDERSSHGDIGLFRGDVFEIRVVERGDGSFRCDVPQSGWEGVVGVTRYGKKVADTISTRMQVYRHIAKWLEKEHQELLKKGPFWLKKPLCSQKDILDGPLKMAKDVGAPALSRYLSNVDLVWRDGAIPLRKCFSE